MLCFAVMVLVANKVDLAEERQVPTEQATEYAERCTLRLLFGTYELFHRQNRSRRGKDCEQPSGTQKFAVRQWFPAIASVRFNSAAAVKDVR